MGLLRDAFTPRQPKRWKRLFVGRAQQIERAIAALEDERAHVVLYGDRGRGKTSLSNILAELAAERGYLVVRSAGSAEITFEAMFAQLLKKIPAEQLALPTAAGGSLASLLPAPPFGATELADVLKYVNRGRVLLVIDEFDRIVDPLMRKHLAETIKNLSDIQACVSLLIVGVATSLEALLGAHPSIQRNVVGIHVPLMTATEIEHLVAAGAQAAGVTFDSMVLAAIVEFSRGLPYCAQLFGLYTVRNAARQERTAVNWPDFVAAVQTILEEAEPGLVAAYERATGGPDNRPATEWLSAIALAESDPHGVFSGTALRSAVYWLSAADVELALDWLCSEAGGEILQPTIQSGREGIVFTNSIMRQYVLLRAFAEQGFVRPEPAIKANGAALGAAGTPTERREPSLRVSAPP